jgi:carbamoyltransferase
MGFVGLELDFAGKIMGAHAYGKVDDTFVQNNHNEKVLRNPLMLLDEIPWRGGIPTRQQNFFRFELETFRDWLASVHRLLGMFIHDIFARYIPFHATVVYGGGAALNTVFNEELYNAFRNLIIPPHCYDGGLSLGCLEFLRIQYGMQEFSTRGFPFWQYDPHGGFAEMPTIMRVVEHLKNGKIVGWFQGKGEIGPRALGHRSILYNPRQTNGKDYLNQRVKKREHWRPYAPSILASHLHEFVVCPLQSPYMLRTVAVRSEAIETMPAVVHVDGTSRVQTVDESDPELRSFHDLLAVWREITGCPGLLNTSMNAAGGPIISTPEQAIQLWRRSPLDVLCVGDQLWEK